MAEKHELPRLAAAARARAVADFDRLSRTEEFRSLPPARLQALLREPQAAGGGGGGAFGGGTARRGGGDALVEGVVQWLGAQTPSPSGSLRGSPKRPGSWGGATSPAAPLRLPARGASELAAGGAGRASPSTPLLASRAASAQARHPASRAVSPLMLAA